MDRCLQKEHEHNMWISYVQSAEMAKCAAEDRRKSDDVVGVGDDSVARSNRCGGMVCLQLGVLRGKPLLAGNKQTDHPFCP